MSVLKKRLKNRMTEPKEKMARRLKAAKRELTYLKRYDYKIINDNLENAVNTLRSIIIAERNRIKH